MRFNVSFLVFVLGCNGQQEDPCLALYTDGMRKCFSDITGLPSDDVKDVLMDEQQNAGTIKTICR